MNIGNQFAVFLLLLSVCVDAPTAEQPACDSVVVARTATEFEALELSVRGESWRPDDLDDTTFEQFDFHAISVFLSSGSAKVKDVRAYEKGGAYTVRYRIDHPKIGRTDIKYSTVWALLPKSAASVGFAEDGAKRGTHRPQILAGVVDSGDLNPAFFGSTFCQDAEDGREQVAMNAAAIDRPPVDDVIKPDPALHRVSQYHTLEIADRSFTVYLAAAVPGELWVIDARVEMRLLRVNESWWFEELKSVSVENVDDDEDDELVINATFVTGIGPTGAQTFPHRFVVDYDGDEWRVAAGF